MHPVMHLAAPMLRLAIPATLCLAATAGLAQVDPVSGIDFVTVGSQGNAPWTGGGLNNNRGQVDYSYRIGKYEVTTQQWCDFMNAALDRPSNDHIPHVFAPTQWGAVSTTPNNPGGQRFMVPPGNEMIPVGGVDWRTSAIFCNYLCAGRSTARAGFLSGAYDVSTFGYFNGGDRFTDQLTHTPGAAYFIPSLDEWMKAAHYDPNRNGPGQGGWWLYSNSSNNPFVYGPPGFVVNGQPATANAGWDDITVPGHDPFSVPLGAYPTVTSPWGLFDVAGGASEWLEEAHTIPGDTLPIYRFFEGSAWAAPLGRDDQVGYPGGDDSPTFFGYDMGFRVAASDSIARKRTRRARPGSSGTSASATGLLATRARVDEPAAQARAHTHHTTTPPRAPTNPPRQPEPSTPPFCAGDETKAEPMLWWAGRITEDSALTASQIESSWANLSLCFQKAIFMDPTLPE